MKRLDLKGGTKWLLFLCKYIHSYLNIRYLKYNTAVGALLGFVGGSFGICSVTLYS